LDARARDAHRRDVELIKTPMSCATNSIQAATCTGRREEHQVLYRDDGEVLGCVLRLEGDPSIYGIRHPPNSMQK
jgi:hypothetical protein